MKSIILIFVANVLIISISAQTIRPVLIGKVYKKPQELPFFKSFTDIGGLVMEPTNTGYTLNRITNGKCTYILLEKIINPNSRGTIYYKLLDTLNLGMIDIKKTLVMLEGCMINNKSDSEIIATVKNANKEKFSSVLKAWRANRKTNKFEKILSKGISCVDFDNDD